MNVDCMQEKLAKAKQGGELPVCVLRVYLPLLLLAHGVQMCFANFRLTGLEICCAHGYIRCVLAASPKLVGLSDRSHISAFVSQFSLF